MWINPNEMHWGLYQVLNDQGTLVNEIDPDLADDDLLSMYKWMVQGRVFDEKALKLQRQGRIGTYAPFSGQEAAQVGSAYALEKKDWIFPTYREVNASLVHGMDMSQYLLYCMGNVRALGPTSESPSIFPVQIIIAAQLPHAVGASWAFKLKGENTISVAYFGDGATSEGDFHEALNLAAVHKLPTLFFCQNNQWAISVPLKSQTASETIAQKAVAYGIAGIRVDGNDVLAVYQATKQAVKRIREGNGPVLIEAVTYRQGPHTTADDPTRYREEDEVQTWKAKDPIERIKKYLMEKGVLTEQLDGRIWNEAAQKMEEAVQKAESIPRSKVTEVFDIVYGELTPSLREQKQEAAAMIGEGEQ